jgi:hypothetical protein
MDSREQRKCLQHPSLPGHGRKLTSHALAQKLGVASVRLPGILSALRRVLNVEGFDVIQVEEASDTVSFDRALLRRQFEIEE